MDAISLAKEDEPEFDHAKFENAARLIHQKKKFEPDMMADDAVRNLTGETYRILASAISREVPDELKAYLKENTFIFSGFKTYHELKEASALLQDDNGGFKSFESFFKDIRHIDSQYNRNYLNAEYKFAVQSAQMAAKWNDFEKDGDRYLLQYRTASDDRVRPEHAALNGTTLPIDDPFWNSYLPPLDWGCRCTAVQVRKDKYPVSNSHEACAAGDRATALPKQKIFRFNPGKDKKIFPPKHPYLPKGCKNCDKGLKLAYNPESPQCQVCGKIKECMDDFFGVKVTIAQYENGGVVESYQLDTTKADYNNVLSVAKAFAEKGAKVVMTPKFDSTRGCQAYDQVYGNLKGTTYYGRCPDLLIDGKWYEHEGFVTSNSKSALSNMLKHGLKQSNRVIIEDCNLKNGYILRNIYSRIQSGVDIEEVWIHHDDKTFLLYSKGKKGR